MWIPTKPPAQITLHHEYLRHVNPNKATGPDNTAPRVLKACAEQLAYIFCIIFNACFSTNTVLTTWKTACIVPIPKRPVFLSMNDLRTVALTSAVMKVCERVVLCKLEKVSKRLHRSTTVYLQEKQEYWWCGGNNNNAVLYSSENIYSHLEKTGSTARLMFFDFQVQQYSHIY